MRTVEVSAERLGEKGADGVAQFRYGGALRPGVLVDVDGKWWEGRWLILVRGGAFSVRGFDELAFVGEPVAASVSMGVGSVSLDRVGRLEGDAAIGGLVFGRPVVESEVKTEKIGTDAMRHHRWTFDPSARLVRVSGSARVEAGAEYSSGFYGVFEGGAFGAAGAGGE